MLRDRALRLLVKDGYSYGSFLDAQIAQVGPRLNKVITARENLNMALMIAGFRADYMFTAMEEGRLLMGLAELTQQDLSLIQMSDMPPGEKRYILCSHKVPQETIERLNKAIKDVLEP